METNRYDLTHGSILDKLLLIALPIMGTSFMQMAYNLTDMFWLGRLGSNAVAASGTVGMYLWLSMAFMVLCRIGAEIGVAQNVGKGDITEARRYAQTALALSVILGVAYGAIMLLLNRPLIGFFRIPEAVVVSDAILYLKIVALGIPPFFVAAAITGVFNGRGNTKIPFISTAVGLVLNMVLDPVLIHVAGWGIAGAAIATIFAQFVVAILMLLAIKVHPHRPFTEFSLLGGIGKAELWQILKWGVPVAVESMFFTLLSMIIARFVAAFGASAVAVQRVGSQIESLTWLLAGGYSTALSAFVGQNFGARQWDRIDKGYRMSIQAMFIWGAFVTAILYFCGRFLFAIFLPQDVQVIQMGVSYLKILAFCQLLACLEFTTSGAFRGFGKTLPPSFVSVTCNLLRVPLAYALSQTALGLDGIWWGITIGAGVRGLWIFLWYQLRSPSKAARQNDFTPSEE